MIKCLHHNAYRCRDEFKPLTAKRPNHDDATNPRSSEARAKLDRWQARKSSPNAT